MSDIVYSSTPLSESLHIPTGSTICELGNKAMKIPDFGIDTKRTDDLCRAEIYIIYYDPDVDIDFLIGSIKKIRYSLSLVWVMWDDALGPTRDFFRKKMSPELVDSMSTRYRDYNMIGFNETRDIE